MIAALRNALSAIVKPEESLELLGAKAGMDKYQVQTSVVRSDDESFRVHVTGGLSPWGDHVGIATCVEGQEAPSIWHHAHFTPAKARLIARLLVERADHLDGTDA